jgi:hypothetical protein
MFEVINDIEYIISNVHNILTDTELIEDLTRNLYFIKINETNNNIINLHFNVDYNHEIITDLLILKNEIVEIKEELINLLYIIYNNTTINNSFKKTIKLSLFKIILFIEIKRIYLIQYFIKYNYIFNETSNYLHDNCYTSLEDELKATNFRIIKLKEYIQKLEQVVL